MKPLWLSMFTKKIEKIRDITFGKLNLFGILEIERVKLSFLSSSALLTL